MEFYEAFHSCNNKLLAPMVPKVVKEEGPTPRPPGPNPPTPILLRSTASLVRGSAFKCSAVDVWCCVSTVGLGVTASGRFQLL